jgi:hypothetical protein
VADVLRKQGNHAEALKTYQQSLSIARHAAEAYPDDGDWQRDFWISYYQVAAVCEKSGDAEASRWWRTAYDVLNDMNRQGCLSLAAGGAISATTPS